MSNVEAIFQPKRLKEGRSFRGLTQLKLAEQIGITKQAISQFEKGTMVPNLDMIYQFVDILEFPINYFFKPYKENLSTPIFFRKNKTSAKKTIFLFETYISWMIDIYHYLNEFLRMPELNMIYKNKLFYSEDEIEEAAKELRRIWGLGNGPISNMTTLLENNGFIISKIDLNVKKVDACSIMLKEKRPMIFLTQNTTSVRSRRDMAHELGHQVLHSWMNKDDFETSSDIIEKEADLFANYFLMPRDAMERECFAVNSSTSLLAMKKRWGTSMLSILYHLYNLDLISNTLFEKLSQNIYRRGWRTHEPYDDEIMQEKPELIKDAIDMLVDNNIKTSYEIEEEMSLPRKDIAELCGLSISFFEDISLKKPKLFLIKK